MGYQRSVAPTTEPSSAPTSGDSVSDLIIDTGYYALLKPARVVLIIVAAIVLRAIAQRLIQRATQRAAEERRGLLGTLRDRVPAGLQEAAGLRSVRRRQRAEALGSVLRSLASVTIFSVAAMMVLSEFGVDLAPLLASAGIVGVALGFGAQNLVRDFIAGLFMLLEDQYGVGDVIDVGAVTGTVEAVGLRITTIRDGRGVLWYVRNGEIVRVGNRSQGWALVTVDVPIGFTRVEEATEVLRAAAQRVAEDPEYAADIIEAPQVLGIEQINIDGAMVRTTVKTHPTAESRISRELRRRLAEALEAAGITHHLAAHRFAIRPAQPTNERRPANPSAD